MSKLFGSINRCRTVADLRGAPPARASPYGPKFSQFHADFWKFWQIVGWRPLGGLAPPPTGNPGSAPVEQECIPVGCVPSTTVAVCSWGSPHPTPLGAGTPRAGTPPGADPPRAGTCNACWDTTPPVDRMTDTREYRATMAEENLIGC